MHCSSLNCVVCAHVHVPVCVPMCVCMCVCARALLGSLSGVPFPPKFVPSAQCSSQCCILMTFVPLPLCPTPISSQYQLWLDSGARSYFNTALNLKFSNVSIITSPGVILTLLFHVGLAASGGSPGSPQRREGFSFLKILLRILVWIWWTWVMCSSWNQLLKQKA